MTGRGVELIKSAMKNPVECLLRGGGGGGVAWRRRRPDNDASGGGASLVDPIKLVN